TIYLHRKTFYLFGRDRTIVDVPTEHPSSKILYIFPFFLYLNFFLTISTLSFFFFFFLHPSLV
ncbi:hypothetical protein HMI55_004573, partial [Coelomomyces lativittatus]